MPEPQKRLETLFLAAFIALALVGGVALFGEELARAVGLSRPAATALAPDR